MEEDYHFCFHHLRHQFNFYVSCNFRRKSEGRRRSCCPGQHVESGHSGNPYAAHIQKKHARIRLEMGKNEISALELCDSRTLCFHHPCLCLDHWPGRLCQRSPHRSNRHLAQGDCCRYGVWLYICPGRGNRMAGIFYPAISLSHQLHENRINKRNCLVSLALSTYYFWRLWV